MFKRFFAITLCLSVILCSVAFADSNNKPIICGNYTVEQFSNDLNSFFENLGSIELAPGETYACEIPLSNGDFAEWECGAFSLEPQTRGSVSAEYNTGLGNNGFYNRVRYDLFGTFSHRIYINVSQTSPVCHFTIYSNEVIDAVPAPLNTFISSAVQTPVNYSSGSSSKADAYATFKTADLVNINIYSRILANSYKAGIMSYTCYFDLTPFS